MTPEQLILEQRVREGFTAAYGMAPAGVAFAPGRVNLIGEHVDYSDGLVLPMPLALGTAIAWAPADEVEAIALDFGEATDRFTHAAPQPHQPTDWRSYLRGMHACLSSAGLPLGGARLAIAGSIPRGSGLSSSASLCVALGRAFAAASALPELDSRLLARAAQSAEHRWAGVHCGIMDQMAVAAGAPGAALLLDCRDLSTQLVPIPADWAVLVVESGVTRGLVDGEYNARRADCEAAAKALALPSLRDATLQQVTAAALPPTIAARARHVVTEIARTAEAVEAIATHDLPRLGQLLRASHASLRDDFAVSVPAVDGLVDCLGALIGEQGGARMTGGGFGGAVVAVLERARLDEVTAALQRDWRTPAGTAPSLLIA